MKAHSKTEASSDAIVWPADISPEDRTVVEILFRLCEVTRWIDKQKDPGVAFERMPWHYTIQGLEIEFLPNWGSYKVGQYSFKKPKTDADFIRVVDGVKKFQDFLEAES